MSSRSAIVKWLWKLPHPTHLVLDGAELLAIGSGPRRFTVAERAVLDKGIALLEAVTIDANGIRTSLRTYRIEKEPDDDDDDTPAPASGPSEIVSIAKLLSDAYRQGAADHAAAYVGIEAAYKAGYTELVNLVKIMSGRLEGLEKAWMGTLNAQAKAAMAAAREAESYGVEPDETGASEAMGQLAGAVLANVMQGPGRKTG